jgi:hypothetical protein
MGDWFLILRQGGRSFWETPIRLFGFSAWSA